MQIIRTSESLYRTFKMKRVYFSAYIPVSDSPLLPGMAVPPPLAREHRLYQADWLLRFYGFTADEMFDDAHPFLDPALDPKVTWALRNIERFPIDVNRAPLEDILRVPGVGTTSALRIVRQRRVGAVKYEDLKKMGVVLKRAKYFITCSGKYFGIKSMVPDEIRNDLLGTGDGEQLSMFGIAGGSAGTLWGAGAPGTLPVINTPKGERTMDSGTVGVFGAREAADGLLGGSYDGLQV